MRLTVDAVFVISLARRPDRLDAFYGGLPPGWQLPVPRVFAAVDGLTEARPAWWKSTPGAWGCYRSHLALVESCLANDIGRVLVLEDDATFVPDFAARVDSLDVPEDCQQLYLGGQHLSTPERGPPGLVVGRNVNRTHAYALFGRDTLELVRDHLQPDPALWTTRHHVDHHYGVLHRERRICVYAVQPWLAGQAGGTSDVGKSAARDRWWSR